MRGVRGWTTARKKLAGHATYDSRRDAYEGVGTAYVMTCGTVELRTGK